MNSPKLKSENNLNLEEKLQPDPHELNKATGILKYFDSAFSSIKIYPRDNPAVTKSIDSFYERMKEFLDEYEELIIKIGEFSFSYKGEIIFQDEEKKSSLPFFFFKDGMRELSFHDGLDKKELQDFLEIIKRDSNLPPEDSDIVNSLWAKDFAHIRYFALDEFLDSDIGKGGEETSSIDREEFSQGEVSLTPEDQIELYKRSIALGLQLNPELEEEEDTENSGNINLPFHVAAAFQKDPPELKSMLSECRSMPPLVAMVNMLFEILFLEERHDEFSATLSVLNQCYKEVIYKSNFPLASIILGRVQELKDMLSGQFEEKEKLLERILQKTTEESFMAQLKEIFLEGQIEDFDSFFQYLRLLGPNTIPLVGDIWEHSKDPFLLQKASTFLQEMSQNDITSLVKIARDDRVALTKEVVAILGRIGGKKIMSHLKNFAGREHKAVRLEIIHALNKIKDKSANKILIKFLSDKNSEVRTRAAMNLRYFRDKTTLEHVIQLAQKKDFKEKGKMEKKALLNFLASTKSTEACAFLQEILKKWSILYRSKQNETRLCAVHALEAMATPEAIKIIKEGTKIRNRAIRQACNIALRKTARKHKSSKAIIVEQGA